MTLCMERRDEIIRGLRTTMSTPSDIFPFPDFKVRGAARTLENYKAFRSQTEILMERRTTAITQQFNSPLILAEQEIDLLKKKVERRDEIIRGLRTTMSTSATLVRQGDHILGFFLPSHINYYILFERIFSPTQHLTTSSQYTPSTHAINTSTQYIPFISNTRDINTSHPITTFHPPRGI